MPRFICRKAARGNAATGFTFASSAVSTTSGLVSAMAQSANGYGVTYQYTYDANGNILSVSDGTNTTSYVYDSANQLVRENNQAGGFTHVWTYDRGGNILSRTEYAYTTGALGAVQSTVSYTYGDSQWGDLLTAYGSRTISSDGIGNTLSDGKRTYTWEHGRQLATVTQNGVQWSNTYNADGLRTKRASGSNTYEYVYYGGSLQYMAYNGQAVYFTHAPDGTPMGMLTEGDAYFYITNLQGDVVGILDAAGNLVVSYTYDAWGNLLSATGSLAGTIGALNPLRYRGYVYDAETQLYYLQSRYYDPEIGRFINADAFASTGQGFTGNNMFAYCLNNPVNGCDPCGTCFHRLDFWNNCEKCSKSRQAIDSSILATTRSYLQGIAQSIVNNLEISCGVGLGLQGSSELIEGMEIGLGVSYDLVNISLVDGQISVLQKSSNGASLSLAFIDILSPDIQYRNMPWDKNGNAWYIDTSRDAFTIYEYSIYLYAGFSFSIGFDFISFVKAVADTFN